MTAYAAAILPARKGLAKRRALEGLAMLLIGDGALALAEPRGHAELWRDGPRPWRALVEPFARRPGLTFALGAAGVAAGLWLASRAHRAS
jgi:hypothetical protein